MKKSRLNRFLEPTSTKQWDTISCSRKQGEAKIDSIQTQDWQITSQMRPIARHHPGTFSVTFTTSPPLQMFSPCNHPHFSTYDLNFDIVNHGFQLQFEWCNWEGYLNSIELHKQINHVSIRPSSCMYYVLHSSQLTHHLLDHLQLV